MEIKYIWGSRVQLSTILYIACRYALLANILYLFAITGVLQAKFVHIDTIKLMSDSTNSCDMWYKIIGALSVVGRVAIIFVWSGRNYAMYYPNNRWILVTCGILGAACIILSIASIMVAGQRFTKMVTWISFMSRACVAQGAGATPLVRNYEDLLSILMVVFEFVSAGMMAIRSIQALREPRSILHRKPLDYLLFEQGMLYFGIVFVFTTASLVLNYSAPGGFLQRLLDAFTLPISGLLTARFLLHLRRWQSKIWVDLAGRSANGSGLSAIIIDLGGGSPGP